MKKEILQQFIDTGNAGYFIAQRKQSNFGKGTDDYTALFITPEVDRKYWNKKVGEMSFDEVEAFNSEEIKTNLHLGKSYGPFQFGVYRNQIVNMTEVTCDSWDLIFKCRELKISDYYKVIELMKELTELEKPL